METMILGNVLVERGKFLNSLPSNNVLYMVLRTSYGASFSRHILLDATPSELRSNRSNGNNIQLLMESMILYFLSLDIQQK
jgi:hypothetical protein